MPIPGVSENGAIIIAKLTCPECGQVSEVDMPEHACVSFYNCPHCKTRLKTKAGECCVYCSYADVPCPDMQINAKSCCAFD